MHYQFKTETFNLLNIYKNKGSMAVMLDFMITARDINLQMCPVQLLTSKMFVYTLKIMFLLYYVGAET